MTQGRGLHACHPVCRKLFLEVAGAGEAPAMHSPAELAALPPNCPPWHMSLRTSQPSCCMDHAPAGAETPACPLFGPQRAQAAAPQCLLLAASGTHARLSHHHDLLSLLEEQGTETPAVP